MDTERLATTTFGRIFIALMASILESRLRYKFFGPGRILKGAGIRSGMKVLEIGCGTGYFTIEAGKMLGENGSLTSIDMLPASVETVAIKVKEANLNSIVQVKKADALNTHMEKESFDMVIMFGIIPAPMLPMEELMAEMHRVLKPSGIMAVWPPSWVHQAIINSGYFRYLNKQNCVYNYQKES